MEATSAVCLIIFYFQFFTNLYLADENPHYTNHKAVFIRENI